jgi:hypothetical protein
MMPDVAFMEALRVETTALQGQYPLLADAIGRASTIIAAGRLFVEDDGLSAMVQSSEDVATYYYVNGQCPCPAGQYRRDVACKHRLSLRLYQRVLDRLYAADEERYDLVAEPAAPPTLRPEWLVSVQGRPFVRFEGLLQLAHEQGLVSLETTVVQCSFDLAVCQATAVFRDGRRFTDIGDACEANVAPHLRKHFIRMAATRASARALRRALYISACSVEELGDEVAA